MVLRASQVGVRLPLVLKISQSIGLAIVVAVMFIARRTDWG